MSRTRPSKSPLSKIKCAVPPLLSPLLIRPINCSTNDKCLEYASLVTKKVSPRKSAPSQVFSVVITMAPSAVIRVISGTSVSLVSSLITSILLPGNRSAILLCKSVKSSFDDVAITKPTSDLLACAISSTLATIASIAARPSRCPRTGSTTSIFTEVFTTEIPPLACSTKTISPSRISNLFCFPTSFIAIPVKCLTAVSYSPKVAESMTFLPPKRLNISRGEAAANVFPPTSVFRQIACQSISPLPAAFSALVHISACSGLSHSKAFAVKYAGSCNILSACTPKIP